MESTFVYCNPSSTTKKEHFANAFLIYRNLKWKFYKEVFPNVKQQNYSIATGKTWKEVPDEIKNIYTQLSIKLSNEDTIAVGYLIFRALSWEIYKKDYPSASVATEEWGQLSPDQKDTYLKIYIELLSQVKPKKKVIMSNNNTNKSGQSKKASTNKTLVELYELFLYLEKDIIVNKEEFGIDSNANRAIARNS
ncbi:hypothetical protein C1645_833663 [Glomus cerebriforme]|uniref:HMG box domain-containing protein n=1 Tax=Glomus cerebriforme TaxID=658196 RepID=A0A397SHW9_9GLOM|nr:hypothetical protein C1645_833663 [Glomus cerebriforme]